jgi:hypothetical protein
MDEDEQPNLRGQCRSTVGWILGSAACAPYLPPAIVPAVESPALESLRAAMKTYVDQTQTFRKEAAAKGHAA